MRSRSMCHSWRSALVKLALLCNVLALCFCGVVLAWVDQQSDDGMQLRMAVEVIRHGDRSPIVTFPNDPNQLETWPEGPGELTYIGMQQHFELGQKLRQRYVYDYPLLSPHYNWTEIYIRSTDVDRTMMSAQSQMAGLFFNESFRSDLPWRPVPVHTLPVAQDSLMRAYDKAVCPRVAALYEQRMQNEEWARLNRENKDLLQKVARIAGLPEPFTVKNAWLVHDPVVCAQAHGRPLAPGLTPQIIDKLRELADFEMSQTFAGEQGQLSSCRLISAIYEHFLHKIDPTQALDPSHTKDGAAASPLMALYSAHDTTVAALLSGLQITDNKTPPYASHVLIELLQSTAADQSYFVRVVYNERVMHLPDCPTDSDLCPFDTFAASILPLRQLARDFDTVCQQPVSAADTENPRSWMAWTFGWIGLLLVIAVGGFAYARYRRRRVPPYASQLSEANANTATAYTSQV